jgi:hypothetical protein
MGVPGTTRDVVERIVGVAIAMGAGVVVLIVMAMGNTSVAEGAMAATASATPGREIEKQSMSKEWLARIAGGESFQDR